ncbi:MAG TPA: DUF2185 domain-containing protein [Tepidisphaeraceae bacterium]|jgi:hypothetical protein
MPDDPIPILSQGHDIAASAALVCVHVAKQGLPIRLARRDEPIHEVDTGWQFHCDVRSHDFETDAVVWSIREVVAHDASVLTILDNRPNTAFRRESLAADWSPEPYEIE